MAQSTGIVVAAAGVTAANQLLLAPLVTKAAPAFNWRIIPAATGLGLALAGLERIAPDFAVGLAWLTLMAVFLVPTSAGTPTPLDNALKAMGYG